MAEARKPEEEEAEGIQKVIPIQGDQFKLFLSSVQSWINIGRRDTLGEDINKLLQRTADLSLGALTPWLTQGGIVVSVASEESFKNDLKRKIMGIALTIRNVSIKEMESCYDVIERLSDLDSRMLAGDIRPEEARSDESMSNAITRCLTSLDRINVAVLAYLVALDILIGAVQANLPLTLMSNVIKGQVGVLTD